MFLIFLVMMMMMAKRIKFLMMMKRKRKRKWFVRDVETKRRWHNNREAKRKRAIKEEREAGKQNEVVKAQLEGSVFNLSADEWKNITLAYEPVWAIGTGLTATPQQAEEIHAYIRSLVADKYGKQAAEDTTILYGGSCNEKNAAELFACPDIDGGLIGGAALVAEKFEAIISAR